MHLTPEEVARKLLNQFRLQPPIDIEALIKAHNITIRTQELEDSISGMLVIKDARVIIGVNENHHPNRQRFTLAHELGHFLLHRGVSSIFVDASTVFFRDGTSSDGSPTGYATRWYNGGQERVNHRETGKNGRNVSP